MKKIMYKLILALGLIVAVLIWNGEIKPTLKGGMANNAEARIGRPATPVSYAGVARRSTVGVNRGGPVNRVGRR